MFVCMYVRTYVHSGRLGYAPMVDTLHLSIYVCPYGRHSTSIYLSIHPSIYVCMYLFIESHSLGGFGFSLLHLFHHLVLDLLDFFVHTRLGLYVCMDGWMDGWMDTSVKDWGYR